MDGLSATTVSAFVFIDILVVAVAVNLAVPTVLTDAGVILSERNFKKTASVIGLATLSAVTEYDSCPE